MIPTRHMDMKNLPEDPTTYSVVMSVTSMDAAGRLRVGTQLVSQVALEIQHLGLIVDITRYNYSS